MQSYLQYKRFQTTAEEQVRLDRARLTDETVTKDESSDTPQESPDLEKGIERNDHAGDARNHDHERHEAVEDASKAEDGGEDDDDDDDDEDVELSTQRTLSRATTQQSERTRLGQILTGINIRKRSTREGGEGDVFVVGYHGSDDPNDPHNWSMARRIACTFLIAAIGCVVGIASSIDSGVLPQAAEEFHVSEVVESMATGLFLIGFGAGALVAGPISETVGRNPVYIVTLVLYMIFIMASALAPNIGAQLAFRFIAGLFGSTPLTCAGGSISDLWSPLERVFAFPVFANAAFTGPISGALVSGFIGQELDWRWAEWITLIISAVVLTGVVLFQPETFPPILLKWKAKHLRVLTGDDRYRAPIEIRRETLSQRLRRALYRPFLLTAREPIIILVGLYLTVVYIVLFTFLDGYTYIFQDTYGISQGLTSICFAGILIGLCGASLLVPLIYRWAKRDLVKIQEQGGDRLPPEFRLWFSMPGGSFAVPISLFWMGWTAYPDISIWSPLAASVLFGYGILCVFVTCYQYIIDAYEVYAASALASITLIRYVAAGGMTIVGIPFYENLGIHYTLTILGSLSALLVPVPYVFYKYGPWIRSKSKYAVSSSTGKE